MKTGVEPVLRKSSDNLLKQLIAADESLCLNRG